MVIVTFSHLCYPEKQLRMQVVIFFLYRIKSIYLISLDELIINHICANLSKFSIKSSPCLCSMSHSLIHHSRQGDWAAVWVINDHTASAAHKHPDTQKWKPKAGTTCPIFSSPSHILLSSDCRLICCLSYSDVNIPGCLWVFSFHFIAKTLSLSRMVKGNLTAWKATKKVKIHSAIN